MTYIITLQTRRLEELDSQIRRERRLTKYLLRSDLPPDPDAGPPITLVLRDDRTAEDGDHDRWLEWMGSVARFNAPGQRDVSVTIDPLRECLEPVPLDGPNGLLKKLPQDLRAQFDRASRSGFAGQISGRVWRALEAVIRARFETLIPVLDWMLAQADPVTLNADDPADRGFQEQQDALRHVLRFSDFPTSSLNTWMRPASRDDPYTAGIVPDPSLTVPSAPPRVEDPEASVMARLLRSPSENSLIDFDVRRSAQAFGMTSQWMEDEQARCDINVLWDASNKRRLEIANVNALGVERRTGTDLLYYHYPTTSFVLVQYKRLEERTSRIKVNKQLRDQLRKLRSVNELSRPADHPHEWRLGADACFLKLAYWPKATARKHVEALAPGLYLPVTYLELLFGPEKPTEDGEEEARYLGYDYVDRYLVGSQFVDLVQEGLVGTIGTSLEQVCEVVKRQTKQGRNVLAAVEYSNESPRERQTRKRQRSSKDRTFVHRAYRQDTLFD